MIQISKSDSHIDLKISSEYAMIDQLIKEAGSYLDKYKLQDRSSLTLVLRELLMNAVVHGNKFKDDQFVNCSIEKLENSTFKITVEDEGCGFDFKSLCMNIPEDPRQIKKRGYILINALSDRIAFNSSGNLVTVYISDKKKSRQSSKTNGGEKYV